MVYDPIHDELFVGVRKHGAWCNGKPIRVSTVKDLRSAFLATGCPHRVGQFMKSVGLTFGRFAGTRRDVAAWADHAAGRRSVWATSVSIQYTPPSQNSSCTRLQPQNTAAHPP